MPGLPAARLQPARPAGIRTRVSSGSCPTPAAAIVKGAVAGLVGTFAMDAVWYGRYRKGGGEDSFAEWEFSAGTKSYDQAGAPAQVGRRIVEGYLQRELPPESAKNMNNAVHLLTGVLWGVVHGVVTTSVGGPRAAHGVVTGPTAWLSSYALLAPAGLYEPPWKYPRDVLWQDLSAHIVFGLGTAVAFRALA